MGDGVRWCSEPTEFCGVLRISAGTARVAAIAAFAVSIALLFPTRPAAALISLTVDISANISGGASNCGGGSNGFSYDYTVTNLATAAPLIDFKIPLSSVGDVCNVQAPAGWSVAFDGNELVFAAESSGADLAADDNQLSGFTLDSPLPGTEEQFTADLLGSEGQTISVPVDPQAPVPASVPEPSTLALLLFGLPGVAWIRRRGRPSYTKSP